MKSDEQLIADIRAGRAPAFDLLYRRHCRKVFGYLVRLVGDRALAEDLLQEVFMKVLRPEGYRPARGRFVSWIFRVARNEGLNAIRGRDREAARVDAASATGAPAHPPGAERVDTRRRILTALSALAPEHRDALVLKEVAGLTYREIASIQAIPEGTVKSRLHHAVRELRPLLRDPAMGET